MKDTLNTENTHYHRNNGRNKKLNPTTHRYVFRLNDEDNAKFLSLFEQSGMKIKAHFITSVLFSKEIKSVKIDKSVMDFYIKLTELYGQFRAVGVNYNQIVKILYRNFSEKKAAAYLFKLEQQTAQMVAICKEIMAISQQLEQHITEKNTKNGR
ncbi:conjugal transfer protein MobA [Capnocytophaga sp. ARDL2]|uniref:conjugal transfer protein MobA n=1 Tax=Capnocytophaga sp. ARDL2 TaxID=3238809 RepID=UPI00355908E7